MANKHLPLRATPRTGIATSRAIGRVTEVVKVDVQNNATGGLDVNLQDQTTRTVILPLVQHLGVAALAENTVQGGYDLVADSVTGMVVGQHLRIINSAADRCYWGEILGIAGTTITVDTPIDFVYTAGSEVTYNNSNMAAVNGTTTPVHFHLRTGSPSIPSSLDITRMIMVCECSSAVDLNKFGDIAGGLARGLVFRTQKNGEYHNIFNVKTNSDLVSLAYDLTVFSASNPSQGINGFSWRLTFGSQGKIGVVLRVPPNGQLGLIVQDDLTDLDKLLCIVEGHVVDEGY